MLFYPDFHYVPTDTKYMVFFLLSMSFGGASVATWRRWCMNE